MIVAYRAQGPALAGPLIATCVKDQDTLIEQSVIPLMTCPLIITVLQNREIDLYSNYT